MDTSKRLVVAAVIVAATAGLLPAAPAAAQAPVYGHKGEQYLRIVCPTNRAEDAQRALFVSYGLDGRILYGTPVPDAIRRGFGKLAYGNREQARRLAQATWPARIDKEIHYVIRADRNRARVYERVSSYRTFGPALDNAWDFSPYGNLAVRRRTSVIRRVLGLPGPGKGC